MYTFSTLPLRSLYKSFSVRCPACRTTFDTRDHPSDTCDESSNTDIATYVSPSAPLLSFSSSPPWWFSACSVCTMRGHTLCADTRAGETPYCRQLSTATDTCTHHVSDLLVLSQHSAVPASDNLTLLVLTTNNTTSTLPDSLLVPSPHAHN